MTKRKRWIEAAGQGLELSFWAHIRLWGTRAPGRTLPAGCRARAPTYLSSRGIDSFRHQRHNRANTKRSFTCPPLPAELKEKKRKVHERTRCVRTVRPTKICCCVLLYTLGQRRGGSEGPAIKPAGGSRPRTTTAVRDGACSRAQAAAAHPLRYSLPLLVVYVVEAAATAPSLPLRVAQAGRWWL